MGDQRHIVGEQEPRAQPGGLRAEGEHGHDPRASPISPAAITGTGAAVAYTQIATISTDTHHTNQEFRASVGAQWPFLSDPGRTVQKDLEIQEYTRPRAPSSPRL